LQSHEREKQEGMLLTQTADIDESTQVSDEQSLLQLLGDDIKTLLTAASEIQHTSE
jgi:hypothetical protein